MTPYLPLVRPGEAAHPSAGRPVPAGSRGFPGQPIGAVEQASWLAPAAPAPARRPGRQQLDQRRPGRRRDQSVIGRQQVHGTACGQLRALIQPPQQRQPASSWAGRSTAAHAIPAGSGAAWRPWPEGLPKRCRGGDGIGLVTGAEAGKCSVSIPGQRAARRSAGLLHRVIYCRHPLDMAGGQSSASWPPGPSRYTPPCAAPRPGSPPANPPAPIACLYPSPGAAGQVQQAIFAHGPGAQAVAARSPGCCPSRAATPVPAA